MQLLAAFRCLVDSPPPNLQLFLGEVHVRTLMPRTPRCLRLLPTRPRRVMKLPMEPSLSLDPWTPVRPIRNPTAVLHPRRAICRNELKVK